MPAAALIRRLLGATLVAVLFATTTASHNHPLGELIGGASASGERAVTTHDPNSRASHWHAVIRFVKEDPCLACQWHRLPGSCPQAGVACPVLSSSFAQTLAALPVRFNSLGQPSSRAPPALL
jgi:hypothetical protein